MKIQNVPESPQTRRHFCCSSRKWGQTWESKKWKSIGTTLVTSTVNMTDQDLIWAPDNGGNQKSAPQKGGEPSLEVTLFESFSPLANAHFLSISRKRGDFL